MRRVLRILARASALLSLAISLAVVFVWIRSYWLSDGWGRSWYVPARQELREFSVASTPGRAQVIIWRLRFDPGVVTNANEKGSDGNISIVNFGILNYRLRWEPQNPSMDRPPIQHWWEASGVYVRSAKVRLNPMPGTQTSVGVLVPYWVLVVLLLMGPGVWMVGWRRRRRRLRAGLCLHCGYDLRASPGRCPECGAMAD